VHEAAYGGVAHYQMVWHHRADADLAGKNDHFPIRRQRKLDLRTKNKIAK
jgi:hypothetical protein